MTQNILDTSPTQTALAGYTLALRHGDDPCPPFMPLVELFQTIFRHAFHGKNYPHFLDHPLNPYQKVLIKKEINHTHGPQCSLVWTSEYSDALFGPFSLNYNQGIFTITLFKGTQWDTQSPEDKKVYTRFVSSVPHWQLGNRHKWVSAVLMATLVPLVTEDLLERILDGHQNKDEARAEIQQRLAKVNPLIEEHLS